MTTHIQQSHSLTPPTTPADKGVPSATPGSSSSSSQSHPRRLMTGPIAQIQASTASKMATKQPSQPFSYASAVRRSSLTPTDEESGGEGGAGTLDTSSNKQRQQTTTRDIPSSHYPISPPTTDPKQSTSSSVFGSMRGGRAHPLPRPASVSPTKNGLSSEHDISPLTLPTSSSGLNRSSSSNLSTRNSIFTPSTVSSSFSASSSKASTAQTSLYSPSPLTRQGAYTDLSSLSSHFNKSLSLDDDPLLRNDKITSLPAFQRNSVKFADPAKKQHQQLPSPPTHSILQQVFEAKSKKNYFYDRKDTPRHNSYQGATRYLFVSGLPAVEEDEFRYNGISLPSSEGRERKKLELSEEMKAAFKTYGDLRGIYARDFIQHQYVILSFYDTRQASRAFRRILLDSHPAFQYQTLYPSFITRERAVQLASHSFTSKFLSVGEGRLTFKLDNTIPISGLETYLKVFGDIESFLPEPQEKGRYSLVYYDDRAAARAWLQLTDDNIPGVEVDWQDKETLNQYLLEIEPKEEESAKSRRRGTPPLIPIPSPPPSNHYQYQQQEQDKRVNDRWSTSPASSPFSSTSPQHSVEPKNQKDLLPDGFTSATSRSPSVLPPIPTSSAFVPNDQKHLGTGGTANAWGLIRDDPIPDHNLIIFENIESGRERRTSCILRNLPNRMTQLELMENLDEIVPREYDFIYLRFDFQSGSNCGFGFVNFISLDALLRFWSARLGQMWDKDNSRKLVMGGFANIQGKKGLMERFRNSSVMEQDIAYQPKIFYSSGPLKGLPEPFPASNNALRKAKSQYGSNLYGLYGNKPKGGFRPVNV